MAPIGVRVEGVLDGVDRVDGVLGSGVEQPTLGVLTLGHT